jgi:hypothetical protein
MRSVSPRTRWCWWTTQASIFGSALRSSDAARDLLLHRSSGMGLASRACAGDGAMGGPSRGRVSIRGAALPRRGRARHVRGPSAARRLRSGNRRRGLSPGARTPRGAAAARAPAGEPRAGDHAPRAHHDRRRARARRDASESAAVLALAPGMELPSGIDTGPVRVARGLTRATQAFSTACAVASGTATLETALFGTPLAVVYRTGRPELRDRPAPGADSAHRPSQHRGGIHGGSRADPGRSHARSAGADVGAVARRSRRARGPASLVERRARAARNAGRVGARGNPACGSSRL